MFNLYYIELFERGDRLGGNIINYIAQICFAHFNKYYIKYDKVLLKYNHSIFVRALFEYIEMYDKQLVESFGYYEHQYVDDSQFFNFEKVDLYTKDFTHIISNIVKLLQMDLVTYFKKNIFPFIKDRLEECARYKNYKMPFDPSKTIVIHLRLDDVRNVADYDGRICSGFYASRINNGEVCFHTNLYDRAYNQQAPLCKEKLQTQIEKLQHKYPDYKIVIVTNPDEKVELPYEIIQNCDESLDLYLLSKADTIILSRSTFSFASLFFGNHSDVNIPLWGHIVCCGVYTKFDNCKYNYFF